MNVLMITQLYAYHTNLMSLCQVYGAVTEVGMLIWKYVVLEVKLQLPDKQFVLFKVLPQTTVYTIKKNLEKIYNKQFVIILNGSNLLSENTFDEIGYTQSDILFLMDRTHGT